MLGVDGGNEEAAARTLVLLDVDGWKYRFSAKNTLRYSEDICFCFFQNVEILTSSISSPNYPPICAYQV